MAVSSSKLLYPPFKWENQKLGLIEDRTKRRWTRSERRQLRHGTLKELPK